MNVALGKLSALTKADALRETQAGGGQYANSKTYTANDGTLHDVPLGTCSTGAFPNAGSLQTIYTQIDNVLYGVGSPQRWTTASSSSGQGSITNSIDVSLTR